MGRAFLLLAVLCCFLSITSTIVHFMINDHGGFFFGMQGFLDDDGEPYFAAWPIGELGRQFPTYVIGLVVLVVLLVATFNWNKPKRVFRWLVVSLVVQASLLLTLSLTWHFDYPVLHERWITCWGTHSQKLGVGAFALVLMPGLTFLSMKFLRPQQ